MAATLIPRTLDEMTPDWATAILRAGGHLRGGHVAALTAEAIGVGRGYVGLNARVQLTLDPADAAAPSSLVVKLPTFVELPAELQALVDLLYATEIQWYRDLQSDSPVRTPVCYWSGMDAASSRYCLVLEDLGHLRVAEQIGSCSPEEARLIVATLARLHAHWWESERLHSLAWLPTSELQAAMWQGLYSAGWPAFFRLLGPALPPAFASIGPRIGDALPRLFRQGTASAKTLVHGDFRIENLLFGAPGTADELVILDWQIAGYGSGPRDLAYFIGQNLTSEARRQSEEALLHLYHDELLAHGVQGYSFAQCYADYQRGLLIAMAIPVNFARAVEDLTQTGSGNLSAEEAQRLQEALANLSAEEKQQFEQAVTAGTALIETMSARNVAAILDNNAQERLDG